MRPRRPPIAQYDAVIARVQPRDLKFDVILIRPEPRFGVIIQPSAKDVLRHQLGLIDGVLDRLQPDARTPIRKARAIARGPDRGVASAPLCIGGNPVLDGQSCRFGQCRVRGDADPHDHHVTGQFHPIRQDGPGDMTRPHKPGQPHAFADIHTMGAVQRAEVIRGRGAATRCKMRGAILISVTAMPRLRATAAASSPI